jgi:alkanesulfonate monooxygenase SsuD/methylene tetrahydromethanopterin reductase-like flavin-dependent oxidoreductase (luciferase family)
VRVFERFSTLNAISSGRAEVIVGRGSFTESFPLFGYDLANYEELFEENLNLFAELLKQEPVTWKGRLRAPLTNQLVYPPSEGPLYTGSAWWQPRVGRPRGALRPAAHAGDHRRQPGALRAVLAALSRAAGEVRQAAAADRRALAGHVAETDEQAKDELWPHYAGLMNRIGRERGWPPIGRDHFEREASDGALFVGSPQTVAAKIVRTVKALGLSRFD